MMRAGAAGYRASPQSTVPTQIPNTVFFMGASVTVYTHIVMDRRTQRVPRPVLLALHVEPHHARISAFRCDHLEHYPAIGRPIEQPVVSDRQGSRRGEVEGKGGGGGLIAAHPGVFHGSGGIGGDVSRSEERR